MQNKPVVALVCGTCQDRNDGCGAQCVPNPSQTGCNAEPITCTKAPTGDGGIGITVPCGTNTIFDSPDSLATPQAVRSSNGQLTVTISVRMNTLNATAFSWNARMYCLGEGSSAQCSLPGPTLEVYPGDKVAVTLVNELPAENAVETQFPSNTLKHPNTVNLHTHGLHISPREDNVMESIVPGGRKTYTYTIPADHLPGLHWYHTHHHGSSTLHVLEGLSGMIRVLEPATATRGVSASYAAMGDPTLLHLTHHPMCSCNPTDDPFSIRSIPLLKSLMGDEQPLQYVPTAGFPVPVTDLVLTNGQYQPFTSLTVGSWKRFDIVSATADTFMELEIINAGGAAVTSSQCQMRLLSIDGVYLRNGPRDISYFNMAMAGRATIAIKCSVAGRFYLATAPDNRAADHETNFLQNLLTLKVSAGTATAPTTPTFTNADIKWPYYFADLLTTTADHKFEQGVEQTGVTYPAGAWLGVGSDCTLPCTGRACPNPVTDANGIDGHSCPHVPFPGEKGIYRFVAPVCSVVDWTINGRGASAHPMHLHAHHFQVVSYTADSGNSDAMLAKWGEIGDWRDTWPALSGKSVVRFRADSFTGAVMIHCHYLYHEDLGMMDRWWTGQRGSAACTATSNATTAEPASTTNCNIAVPAEAFGHTYTRGLLGSIQWHLRTPDLATNKCWLFSCYSSNKHRILAAVGGYHHCPVFRVKPLKM